MFVSIKIYCRRKEITIFKAMPSSRKITVYAIVPILQQLFMSVKSAKVFCCKYAEDSEKIREI